ncbi:MAG: hypothetical protein HC875_31625 [Anaerolineales bacterium]|nr:hypothetical protein [Anaerolineales bacterium]
MMLPISAGVWDRLPLIAFVQQPHRLLSVTALALAILAGAAVAYLPDRLSFGLTVLGVLLIFVSAGPLLYPALLLAAACAAHSERYAGLRTRQRGDWDHLLWRISAGLGKANPARVAAGAAVPGRRAH